ncbi:MAG: hypothetical protein CO090_07065 [Acidobacteria bacterium CG_4_9_14_3_um_filter_49_7]|nr:MAG: hypothetical protein CO090_07065 [Acidobacteria bacterium CG_4_9_14_3_um_filter_49_7]
MAISLSSSISAFSFFASFFVPFFVSFFVSFFFSFFVSFTEVSLSWYCLISSSSSPVVSRTSFSSLSASSSIF